MTAYSLGFRVPYTFAAHQGHGGGRHPFLQAGCEAGASGIEGLWFSGLGFRIEATSTHTLTLSSYCGVVPIEQAVLIAVPLPMKPSAVCRGSS